MIVGKTKATPTTGILLPFGQKRSKFGRMLAAAAPLPAGGFTSTPAGRLSPMGALDVTVAVDPVRINGQTTDERGVVIAGEAPPWYKQGAWPWLILAAGLAAVWLLVKDDVEEEGARVQRPFDG